MDKKSILKKPQDNPNILKFTKSIQCIRCVERPIMQIDDHNFISSYFCKNGHNIPENLIKFSDYLSEIQKIIRREKCYRCGKKYFYTSRYPFWLCQCNKTYCAECYAVHSSHYLSHTVIDVSEASYKCYLHSEYFISFCADCNENVCKLCSLNKHKSHNLISYESINPNSDDLKVYFDIIKEHYNDVQKVEKKIDELINKIKEIFNKTVILLENKLQTEKIFFIEYLTAMKDNKLNYQVIQNLLENISEANFYSKELNNIKNQTITDDNLNSSANNIISSLYGILLNYSNEEEIKKIELVNYDKKFKILMDKEIESIGIKPKIKDKEIVNERKNISIFKSNSHKPTKTEQTEKRLNQDRRLNTYFNTNKFAIKSNKKAIENNKVIPDNNIKCKLLKYSNAFNAINIFNKSMNKKKVNLSVDPKSKNNPIKNRIGEYPLLDDSLLKMFIENNNGLKESQQFNENNGINNNSSNDSSERLKKLKTLKPNYSTKFRKNEIEIQKEVENLKIENMKTNSSKSKKSKKRYLKRENVEYKLTENNNNNEDINNNSEEENEKLKNDELKEIVRKNIVIDFNYTDIENLFLDRIPYPKEISEIIYLKSKDLFLLYDGFFFNIYDYKLDKILYEIIICKKIDKFFPLSDEDDFFALISEENSKMDIYYLPPDNKNFICTQEIYKNDICLRNKLNIKILIDHIIYISNEIFLLLMNNILCVFKKDENDFFKIEKIVKLNKNIISFNGMKFNTILTILFTGKFLYLFNNEKYLVNHRMSLTDNADEIRKIIKLNDDYIACLFENYIIFVSTEGKEILGNYRFENCKLNIITDIFSPIQNIFLIAKCINLEGSKENSLFIEVYQFKESDDINDICYFKSRKKIKFIMTHFENFVAENMKFENEFISNLNFIKNKMIIFCYRKRLFVLKKNKDKNGWDS